MKTAVVIEGGNVAANGGLDDGDLSLRGSGLDGRRRIEIGSCQSHLFVAYSSVQMVRELLDELLLGRVFLRGECDE